MNEEYFFVRKLGLGKEVVSLSLVVTEVSRGTILRDQKRWRRYVLYWVSFWVLMLLSASQMELQLQNY